MGGQVLIYIAGPMTGYYRFNFPSFDMARDELIGLGHTVISPADMDRKVGFDPAHLPDDWDWCEIPPSFDIEAAITRDIEAVRRADAVYVLAGSALSKGATAEIAIANWCGKEIICAGHCTKAKTPT